MGVTDTTASQTHSSGGERLKVRVGAVHRQSEVVVSYELRGVGDEPLPSFTAGSHIDVYLSNGMRRSYSLLNSPNDRDRYVIGVGRAANSKGGSAFIHQSLRPGDVLEISAPKNTFPLSEGKGRTILVGGGIGITPLLSMADRLDDLGGDWTMHYATRSRGSAAFLDELARYGDRVHLHFDDEHGGAPLDLRSGADDESLYGFDLYAPARDYPLRVLLLGHRPGRRRRI
jgi:vanillate O-demethylase ferredoxin subunit